MSPAAAARTPGRPVTEKGLVYRLVRLGWLVYFRLRHRLRVEGTEHLPAEGGCLVVANHASLLDIPLVAASTRRHVCFVARDTLLRSRVVAFLVRHTGAVTIRRGTADRTAIREILAHLEAGDVVAIYPEGTRSTDGRVGPFRRGMALIARTAGVPVVPCALRGTGAVLPPGARFPGPGPCTVRYAAPIDPADGDPLERAREAIVALVEGPSASRGD